MPGIIISDRERRRRGVRRLAVALAALVASAALSAGTTSASVEWDSSTPVRYTDLNVDARVVDPQFSWDPIPGAAKYEVEVNSSDEWAVGSRVCCDEKAIGTSLSPLKLLPNNTYYWRMRAIDAAGKAGQWNAWCGSDVRTCDVPVGFDKTFDNVDPTIPGLRVRDSAADAAPAAGTSGLPTTDAPVIAWDPVAGASSYELRVAPWVSSGGYCNWTALGARTFITATTAWTPLAWANSSPLGNGSPPVASETWFLQDGTSYCVRARARSDRDALNGEIVSDWTQIGGLGRAAFTYRAPTLPPCGPAATPASAYHNEPSRQQATPRMPIFTWDRVAGACGYYVVVAKDPEFTKIMDAGFTIVPAYAPRKAGGSTTYTDETTSYYWAVMPSVSPNGDGVSTQPQENHPQPFDKRSVPPALLSPAGDVSGVPSFRWTAAEGAREYRIQVDDEATFGTPITDVVTASTAYTSTSKYPPNTTLYWRVRANDENRVGLSWSASATFTVLPPETVIQSGPSLTASVASFTFASNLPDASFKCKLDGPGTKVGLLVRCTSPATYGPLADGSYKFTVAAADLAGNADPTPASRAFTVDTTAPDTSISSAPPATTSSGSVSFAFASTKGSSTFECKLDGPGATTGVWVQCASPKAYAGLADGGYAFSVRATDPAGNTDPAPAAHRFTVDTEVPDTVITAGPGAATTASMASLAFNASEAGASFECRLDGPAGSLGRWESCGSPRLYTGLAAGDYGFSVRARDAAGNTDATPATWSFALIAPASPQLPVISPMEPLTPTAPPPVGPAPTPITPHLGIPAFHPPTRPVPVRRGSARLRFSCFDPDGCAGATFVVHRRAKGRQPAFTIKLKVGVSAPGTRGVAVRLDRAARRALTRAGGRGIAVTMRRAAARSGTRFTLVASR